MQYAPLTLHQSLSKEDFLVLSQVFPDLQMERSKTGQVTIMSPVKKGSGRWEAYLITIIGSWALQQQTGEVFSSATGIELPDGSIRSPDCAWVSNQRMIDQSDDEFLRAIPDFVVKIRSSSDRIALLQKKMKESWMANGVRLAWLIDPYQEKVWIYRNGQAPELIKGFAGRRLSGEGVMPGLEFSLDYML